jgi:hypothetical protein
MGSLFFYFKEIQFFKLLTKAYPDKDLKILQLGLKIDPASKAITDT